ncbi:2-dehydropantoate 2-reductase [Paenibacillus sp. KQZ6P-2]|uniref:2-dehydropantoate 2-reductase n=1 Tax=Paenibacillus mangrovi TaxID=2931978 RepID=A0A9X1WLA9_9BACL|nr:2-dehydropantoate 2-reductase [Paenibacillus mangrovi]MCJ8011382.1 2-dehydropantoate 2-reductase [Paenibacillus mangrovi]
MIIDLIGGGSLGLLYGGKLAAAGVKVRLWCRSAEQVEQLQMKGILIQNTYGAAEALAKPEAFTAGVIEEFASYWKQEPGQWIFLMTKQKDTEAVCQMSAGLLEQDKLAQDRRPGVVGFQNGYGHMERIERILPGWPLYAAVTTEGAKRTALHEVLHAGMGTTWIGVTEQSNIGREIAVNPDHLVKMLQKAGFSAVLSNDIDSRIYRKLLINAVINPLTALWDISNGELLASDKRMQMMRMLLDEALVVYEACGISCDEDIWEQIVEVCAATAGNTSSMRKDVQDGAATEVDWINGSIVALAGKAGIRAAAHEMVTGIIKGLTIREE